jgi:excisionase family DNA binding protein
MAKYVGGKEASELLGVHERTLYQWDKKGQIETIRTPGGKRLYNVERFIQEKQLINEDKELTEKISKTNNKLKITYCRVSSIGQKGDLERQKEELSSHYPNHLMITDIGSGLNLNKRGIRKIIKLAIEGRVEELVISYKDRLARFGYELIEDLIKEYSKGKIIILNNKNNKLPEEELAYDVLQIMNVFVSKMNGLRRYKKNLFLDDIS